jgi:hypothetical protein
VSVRTQLFWCTFLSLALVRGDNFSWCISTSCSKRREGKYMKFNLFWTAALMNVNRHLLSPVILPMGKNSYYLWRWKCQSWSGHDSEEKILSLLTIKPHLTKL